MPPPPISPAIAVNPKSDISVIAPALIRFGSPSLRYTDIIISKGDLPIASAASITPGSTSARACSTCLAKNGIVDTTSGTIAAFGPILVLTINLVKGATRASRIMNGIDLKILVILSSMI